MKLTHENGEPSKSWSIGLPNKEFKVEGDIIVTLYDGVPATVKAVYKRRSILLHFNRACDGKAILHVLKGKRGTLEKPSVVIDEPVPSHL